MLSIICWKWKGIQPKKRIEFTSQHVNVLYAMLRRNLTIDFELVCITDDIEGIRPEVRTIPLWSIYSEKGGCFRRLLVFHPEFESILGNNRFASMDLDVVITGNCDSIFSRSEDFIIWGEEWRKWVYCGSLWIMNTGARPQVYQKFKPNNYQLSPNGKYRGGTDQKVINDILYPGEVTFGAKEGIYSFQTDIMIYHIKKVSNYGVRKVFGGNGKLPKNAKMVFFNGKYDPSNQGLWRDYIWIRENWHE